MAKPEIKDFFVLIFTLRKLLENCREKTLTPAQLFNSYLLMPGQGSCGRNF